MTNQTIRHHHCGCIAAQIRPPADGDHGIEVILQHCKDPQHRQATSYNYADPGEPTTHHDLICLSQGIKTARDQAKAYQQIRNALGLNPRDQPLIEPDNQ